MMGSLALVLHAHLPFVRHSEHESFHEENWLFEAISESYVPLLQMMQRVLRRGIRFQITLSVSPTLGAMLGDSLLRDRYLRHLRRLDGLLERECDRNRSDKRLSALSKFYRDFLRKRGEPLLKNGTAICSEFLGNFAEPAPWK